MNTNWGHHTMGGPLFSYKDAGFYNEFHILGKCVKLKKSVLNKDYHKVLKKWYIAQTGDEPNMDKPKSFNEKILWLLLNENSELKSDLSERLKLREYITKTAGSDYLLPLAGIWDAAENIDIDDLSEHFIVKLNNIKSCGMLAENRADIAPNKISRSIKIFKQKALSASEYQPHRAQNISSEIIIEEIPENFSEELIKYKAWCFNGSPVYICAEKGSGKNITRNIYDLDWELQTFEYKYKNSQKMIQPPANMHRLLDACQKLSKDFCFMQIDFYNIEERLYIDEISFVPDGFATEFSPSDAGILLGKMLKLPSEIKNDNFVKICA